MDLRITPIEGLEQQEKWESILKLGFPVPTGGSFLDDFPVWDERYRAQILKLGAWQGNEMVATASGRLALLKGNCDSIPIVIIGAVATHPDFRGQGHATTLVEKIVSWAGDAGACAAMLWGSEHGFYERLGFGLCGYQVRIPLKEIEVFHSQNKFSTIHRGWNPSLLKLLMKRDVGLEIGPMEEAWISAHKNVQWFWEGEASAPLAYIAYGKGIDLGGFIHEWGGERRALFRLLYLAKQIHPDAQILGSPQKFNELRIPFDAGAVESLCLAKILNPEKNVQKIVHAFFPEISLKVERVAAEEYKVKIGTSEFREISGANLTELLFGGNRIPFQRESLLPLPIWFWGLDAA